jgi:hypothetical protein
MLGEELYSQGKNTGVAQRVFASPHEKAEPFRTSGGTAANLELLKYSGECWLGVHGYNRFESCLLATAVAKKRFSNPCRRVN